MGYLLTIYSKSAYKEYLLPAVINANHSVMLYKGLFRLSEDVKLELENVKGQWIFTKSEGYQLTYTDSSQDCTGKPLTDGNLCTLKLRSGETLTIIVNVTDTFFHVFDKYSLHGVDQITVGSGEQNTIQYDFMHVVSKVHAIIMKKNGGYLLEDRSGNGLYVNARRVVGSRMLEYGDLINVFGLAIVFLGEFIAVDMTGENTRVQQRVLRPYQRGGEPSAQPVSAEAVHTFHRAPRYLPKLAEDTVTIEAPPAPKEDDREPAILSIGPAITMAIPMILGCGLSILGTGSGSAIFMYTGLVTAISSAIIGVIWAMVNISHTKKKLRENELKRFEVYGEYLISCANEVQEKYNRNSDILRELYIGADVCVRFDHTSPQLWNRNRNHKDFLLERLGIGESPFQVKIDSPKERFSMLNDSLADKARMIRENYAMLKDVPVCLDMERKLIGIIGGEGKAGCYPVVYDLVAQLAAGNCYTDVKLGFIYDSEKTDAAGKWGFARWLPHVWSEDRRVRYVADNKLDASDVFYELVKVMRLRDEEITGNTKVVDEKFKPHYILFIDDVSLLEGELITTFLLDKRDLGITVVLLAESYEELPNACECIVENTKDFQGVYEVTDPIEDRKRLKLDSITAEELERFARTLANIQVNETETGGELPSSLTFLEMYGVSKLSELNVEERWRKNRTYDNIRGLLGQKSGGAPCYLDVHEKYHGPHGLIAGTTGSGKSETLQTYMLSLAINYSPDDVGFFVIDYKGGGMANLFDGCPLLKGKFSNLSGNKVHRPMVSIKSENVRRQRVFNEHGVNNINNYTRLYKNGEATLPVPHMFIIIDEFAELKREEPDFMKELISVAQVGRSLGVHLILATQKPSGTVDDNIWSNAKFRLCLRVQDQQDSKDMLHRSDAAFITQAGRCYLQVGNDELFELFQSGYSGAAYEEDDANAQKDIATMLSVTGKQALIGSHTKIKRRDREKARWISMLVNLVEVAAAGPGEVESCLANRTKLDALVAKFFECTASAKLDYQDNDYNRQCVKNLIIVYGHAKKMGKTTLEGYAVRVLDMAAQGRMKLPEQKERTQLEAIVEYLGVLARSSGYVHNLQLWLPVLPTEMYLRDLPGYTQNAFDGTNWPQASAQWELEAIVGLYDDPVNQVQLPLTVDFAGNGSHAVCGTVVSGKSTFITTLIYSLVNRYTPDMLQIYALDFSSRMMSAFEGLAHVGGVMYENDLETISKFFTMLSGMLEERKGILRGGDYKQYVQSHGDLNHPDMPAIIVVFDNYAAFRTKTEYIYDDYMMRLSQEGVGCGIYLLISALGFSANEIPGRLGENIRTTICLEMNDRFAYCDALRDMHIDVMPETNVKGRGLAKIGDSILEFQTALAVEAQDDFARSQLIAESCAKLNSAWTGKRARAIPVIPEKPTWKEFSDMEQVASMRREGRYIPIGYDQRNANAYGIDLRRTYSYIISGKARTGKTNLLRVLMASTAGMDVDVAVVDFTQEFIGQAQDFGFRHITTDREMYQFFMELKPDFSERNKFKWECARSGQTDEEIYDGMQRYRKIVILIGNLVEFVKHIDTPEEGIETMMPFVSNLLDRGAGHNVYWFACLNQDNVSEVSGQSAFEYFVRDKVGIHFGGNVDAQRILDFDYVKFSDRPKVIKAGIGLLAQGNDEAATSVVVPLYRR